LREPERRHDSCLKGTTTKRKIARKKQLRGKISRFLGKKVVGGNVETMKNSRGLRKSPSVTAGGEKTEDLRGAAGYEGALEEDSRRETALDQFKQKGSGQLQCVKVVIKRKRAKGKTPYMTERDTSHLGQMTSPDTI